MAVTAPDPGSDLISQVQERLNALCTQFYTYTGVIQRDAPPSSVRGEPVELSQATPASSTEQAKSMAKDIIISHKALHDLIMHVPVIEATENEQLKAITDLVAENEALGAQLGQEVAAAQEQLLEVQALYAVLANRQLQDSGQTQMLLDSGGSA